MDLLNFLLNILFPIIPFIKNPSSLTVFTLIWIVFILFLGIWWVINFKKETNSCQAEIEKLLEILKKFDPQTICQDFEKFKQSLSNNLGNLWSDFTNTLIITKKEDKNLIYKPIEAKYFFNEENLIFPKINLQFYRTVPSILTGLGILGTFLGLTLGLSKINLGTSDINVLKEGIKGLLSGVSMAFSTSVWGIGLSIFFLWFKNRKLKNSLQKLREFQTHIDKLFIWKSSEQLLSEIFQQAEEQTTQLKKFNTDLAISIAAALDEKLAQRLTPALEKLLEAIDELTKTGTTQIAKTITQEAGTEIIKLKDVLVEVRETLQTTVFQAQKNSQEITETFQQFLKTIEEKQTTFSAKLQDIVQSLVSKIKESISYQQEEIKIATSQFTERFLSSFKDISTNINMIFKTMEEKVNELTNLLTKRVEELTDQYQIEQEKLESIVHQINNVLENFQITVKEANKMAERFTQSAEPLKVVSTQLTQTVEKTQKISESLKNSFYSYQEMLREYLLKIQEMINTLNTSSQRTQEAWQAYENKFGEIKEDLETVLEKLSKELQQYATVVTKNVEEVLIKFDTLLGEAVQHLAGGVEELKEAIEELDEKLEKLSSA